jgi:hypothetical protein
MVARKNTNPMVRLNDAFLSVFEPLIAWNESGRFRDFQRSIEQACRFLTSYLQNFIIRLLSMKICERRTDGTMLGIEVHALIRF